MYCSLDACPYCSYESCEIICMSISCQEPECDSLFYIEKQYCPICLEYPVYEGIDIVVSNGWNMISFSCSENTEAIDAF